MSSKINTNGLYDDVEYNAQIAKTHFIDKTLSYKILHNATITFYENLETHYQQYTLHDENSQLISGADNKEIIAQNCTKLNTAPPCGFQNLQFSLVKLEMYGDI